MICDNCIHMGVCYIYEAKHPEESCQFFKGMCKDCQFFKQDNALSGLCTVSEGRFVGKNGCLLWTEKKSFQKHPNSEA